MSVNATPGRRAATTLGLATLQQLVRPTVNIIYISLHNYMLACIYTNNIIIKNTFDSLISDEVEKKLTHCDTVHEDQVHSSSNLNTIILL